MTHERTLTDLEQLETIIREIPLVLQPIISVQSVAHGKVRRPTMSHFSTLEAGKFVVGQFPTTGLLTRDRSWLTRRYDPRLDWPDQP
jgi:hypothetical protein